MVKTKKTEDNNKLILQVAPRKVFGRKLKKLRAEGAIPANIYGPEFKSTALSTNFKDFIKVYKIAKETGVVYLKWDAELVPVLIKNLQRHPVTDNILHIDFRKIDLAKKIQTEVPIKVVGASPAVTEKGGVLLISSETLEVEALPTEIPKQIEVDISKIIEIAQEIKVADLPKPNQYEIKTPPEKVVVSVVAHKEESITPEVTAAAPEVITEVKPEEGAEVTPVAAAAQGKPSEPETAKKPTVQPPTAKSQKPPKK
jgi:large subunit ribosomal protein L25